MWQWKAHDSISFFNVCLVFTGLSESPEGATVSFGCHWIPRRISGAFLQTCALSDFRDLPLPVTTGWRSP